MQHQEDKIDGAVWPISMTELDISERLVVWAFRRWIQGLRRNDGAHWAMVGREFGRQFNGQDGTRALAGFARLIDSWQRYARRVVRLHQACCPCLSADEASLIGFVAACQGLSPSLARVRAESLVRDEGVGDLLEAGMQLAAVMRRHGLPLPQRRLACLAGAQETAPRPTIH